MFAGNNSEYIFIPYAAKKTDTGARKETFRYYSYLTAKGRHANGFHNLPDESQYSTDLKTTLSSSPPTETITYKMMI